MEKVSFSKNREEKSYYYNEKRIKKPGAKAGF